LEQQSDNPAPWLVFEPASEPSEAPAVESAAADPVPEPELVQDVTAVLKSPAAVWLDEAGIEIIRATRTWIQYGTVGFAVICIIIGAVEGLFGR
jgi:hypothetical protein